MTPVEVVGVAPNLDRLERPGRHRFNHALTTLADGSTLTIPVVVLAGACPRPRVLAIAGVHGDEMEGIVVLQEMAASLDPAALSGTLVILPVANPPAFRAARRRSPLDDLDLNRTFPGDPAGSPSQRLAHHLLHDYALEADFVLSMHSWGSKGLVVPYVEFPGGDGAVVRRSFRAAGALGLEFCRISQWHPGLLVACAVRGGIPAVETEVGGLGIQQEATRSRYRCVVENLLRHVGLLPGGLRPATRARVVRHVDVVAPVGGVLRRTRELGEEISRGTPIATVRDLHGEVRAELKSPVGGIVAAYRLCNSVNRGEAVATLFEGLAYQDLDV